MRTFRRFLEKFGKAFIPRRVYPNLHEYLLKAGLQKVPYTFFGALFYFIIAIASVMYVVFVYPIVAGFDFLRFFLATFFSWILLSILIATIIILVIYFYLDLKIFKRTTAIEEMLPEFLQQISSNLKGGMTFENAMWNAINPRFKVLAAETTEVLKRVMTGTSTSEALTHFARKYKSNALKRTIDLIVSELEGGGNISVLLDKMVSDMERTKELRSELSASVVGYIIMISVVVTVMGPLLFALSFQLMFLITSFISNLAPTLRSPSSGIITFGGAQLDTADFKLFSVIAILSISMVASFIVSLVEKGHIKGGVKYIPIYIGASLIFYFVFLSLISGAFTFF